MHMRLFLLTGVVAVCIFPRAAAGVPKRPHPDAVNLADMFETDTRARYAPVGRVTWGKGELRLGAGASILRDLRMGSPAELAITLSFPPVGEGEDSSTGFDLVMGYGHWLHIVLIRRAGKGGSPGEVRIEHSCTAEGNKFIRRPVRRFSLVAPPGSGVWKVRYHYSLVEVWFGEKTVAVGYVPSIHEFCVPVAFMVQQGKKGQVTLRGIRVRAAAPPSPLAAEQKKKLTELTDLGLKVIELRDARRYAEADAAARRKWEYAKALLGERHPWTITALGGIGQGLGQRDRAGSFVYLDRAIRLAKEVYGEDHPGTAHWLDVWARVRDTSDLAGALAFHDRALAIYARALGEESLPVADILEGMGATFRKMAVAREEPQYYEKSLEHYEKALAIRRKVLSPADARIAAALRHVMAGLAAKGADKEACARGEEALAILEKGPERVELTDLHIELALRLTKLQNHGRARTHANAARTLLRKGVGPGPQRVDSWHGLAGLYIQQAKYEEARSCLTAGRQLFEQVGGSIDKVEGTYLILSATVLVGQGKNREALGEYRKALALQLRLAAQQLPFLSETEALEYLASSNSQRNLILRWALYRVPDTPAAEAYRTVWETRALVSRTLAARQQLAVKSPDGRAALERLSAVRTELARLALSPVAPGQGAARQKQLTALTLRKEELERELGKHSEAFRRQLQMEEADFTRLAAVLPPDVAVVELTAIPLPLRLTGGYGAFVLRRTAAAPGYAVAFIHLGEAEPIDSAVTSWREELLGEELRAPARRPAGQPAADDGQDGTLRALVWEKIAPHLAGCKAVVLIPEGPLARVPWAALPGKKPGTFLVEEYAVATATSGQQVYALLTQPAPGGQDLLLVAGVDYDRRLAAAPGKQLAFRGPPAADNARPAWRDLPGTAVEARLVADQWRGGPGRQEDKAVLKLLERGQASAAAVREALPGARYVHLATHGFFAHRKFRSAFRHDVEREGLLPGTLDTGMRRATVTGRSPMILSGLVLAGANRPPRLEPQSRTVEANGILTAEEVANADLGGTELVVLSACHTGVGEVAGGEGVFGLQRAFGLAGARTVVASLWKIDDSATQALMGELYKNLWGRKLGKLEALRQAQLALLRRYDPEGRRLGATHLEGVLPPLYWAAFTLSGDWR